MYYYSTLDGKLCRKGSENPPLLLAEKYYNRDDNVRNDGDSGEELRSEPGHGASPAKRCAERITPERDLSRHRRREARELPIQSARVDGACVPSTLGGTADRQHPSQESPGAFFYWENVPEQAVCQALTKEVHPMYNKFSTDLNFVAR